MMRRKKEIIPLGPIDFDKDLLQMRLTITRTWTPNLEHYIDDDDKQVKNVFEAAQLDQDMYDNQMVDVVECLGDFDIDVEFSVVGRDGAQRSASRDVSGD